MKNSSAFLSNPPVNLTAPHAMQVWLDFDGTVTQQDVLDTLIVRYAKDDSWKLIEERWRVGQIGSRECLSEELAIVRITEAEVPTFLQTIGIDPGFERLMNLFRSQAIPCTIVSDGIEQFIRPLLARAGANDLPIRCNRVEHRGRSLKLLCPHASDTCESRSAHCKCSSIAAVGQPTRADVYIGDGRSDLCAARKARVVFAKGVLATALANEGKAFIPFATLNDIADALESAWTSLVPSPGTPGEG